RSRLTNQSIAIDTLLGLQPGSLQLQLGDVAAAEQLPLLTPGHPADILSQRPDVALAELNWQAAQLDAGAARYRKLPTLTLSLSFSDQSDRAADLLDIDDWVGTVLSGLFAPLYQGGRLQANLEQAEAVAAELAANYAEAGLSALADVERALVESQAVESQLQLRGDSLRAAMISNELATVRYSAGQVSLLTLLETRRALDSARQDHLLAKQAVLEARIDLALALGGTWLEIPKEGVEIALTMKPTIKTD
ncbi:MAG: TolC family protein, partial [Pseudomonadota bacterium]